MGFGAAIGVVFLAVVGVVTLGLIPEYMPSRELNAEINERTGESVCVIHCKKIHRIENRKGVYESTTKHKPFSCL